ncbi:hypothetical protein GobsT_64290 [Gemmata obscuriglobus]|uniref:DNA-binding protein n=1 Tax=Gemmata obscuriglobus TaxID=114 RepID=A0A2Z3GUW2_9BACT|nr:hypothetical protein [Gemmata obscuriglobus]AWM35852.1 hypothetical protein C1280_01665 [Gemmata obscuriglobus]QEG31606.1 hypothetical protein GobsT_64290 [Gemmata obscuriglobus]VTS10948.1 unnamed protein product [Gemmata obscuriglobus UQM 2246]
MSSPDFNAVIERLDRIEAALTRLSPAPRATAAPTAKRLTSGQACETLGVCRNTLRKYAAMGLCSVIRPSGQRGPNKRIYFLPDEIAALALGEDVAREHMARKKRKPRNP